jgi:hypothetical protein
MRLKRKEEKRRRSRALRVYIPEREGKAVNHCQAPVGDGQSVREVTW